MVSATARGMQCRNKLIIVDRQTDRRSLTGDPVRHVMTYDIGVVPEVWNPILYFHSILGRMDTRKTINRLWGFMANLDS